MKVHNLFLMIFMLAGGIAPRFPMEEFQYQMSTQSLSFHHGRGIETDNGRALLKF